MAETTQDVAADETYLDDWTEHLSGLATQGITISSVVVTASHSATVSAASPAGAGLVRENGEALELNCGVVFKLDTSAVPSPPVDIKVTVAPTLSNGDTPVRHHTIGVTSG